MKFPDHFRDPNVAIGPAGEPMDYIGLATAWPEGVPHPAPFENLGQAAGVVDSDGNFAWIDDFPEHGYLVPQDWVAP